MIMLTRRGVRLHFPPVRVLISDEVTIMRYSNELPSCDQLIALYANAGWTACIRDPEQLLRAMERSLYVVTAWDGDDLVGLARAVGDGETILYIQDVIVHADHHRGGVGTQLTAMLLSAFPAVRQIVLLTDDSPASADFYMGLGFARAEERACAAYVQFR